MARQEGFGCRVDELIDPGQPPSPTDKELRQIQQSFLDIFSLLY